MDLRNRLYMALPPALKNWAAWWYGRHLTWWRYGPDFPHYTQQIAERTGWPPEQFRHYQLERLQALVTHALDNVPYYQSRYQGMLTHGQEISSLDDLRKLPILEKGDLRAEPEKFLAKGADPRHLFQEHTSGSTGTPLFLWWDRQTCQKNYAFMEARIRHPAGVRWGEPWAMLGGQLIMPANQRKPPFWIWSRSYHQLYLSAYHISAETAPAYLEALRRHRVTHMIGYASALYALAAVADPEEARRVGLRAIISNAEPLYESYRSRIEETFGVRCYDTYSSAEVTFLATECAHRRMHLWPDFGIVEVLDGDRPVSPGEEGDLVATGFINWTMPLIRYRTGDRIALDPNSCACGWQTPVIQTLGGRSNDLLVTPSGRQVYLNATAIGKWSHGILEFQVVQEATDKVTLNVVPSRDYSPEQGAYLVQRLSERLGSELEIDLNVVDAIERGPSGKFRVVVNTLPMIGSN